MLICQRVGEHHGGVPPAGADEQAHPHKVQRHAQDHGEHIQVCQTESNKSGLIFVEQGRDRSQHKVLRAAALPGASRPDRLQRGKVW